MSQISIGMKNPKKGRAPTAKKARKNVKKETIRIRGSTTDASQLQVQDGDNVIIKKLKFWQLVQWFILVTAFIYRNQQRSYTSDNWSYTSDNYHWYNFVADFNIRNCFEAITAKRRDAYGYPGIEGYHGYIWWSVDTDWEHCSI